jgi:hypothetical protein
MLHSRPAKCRARPNPLAAWRTRLLATEIASCHLLCFRHSSIRGTSSTEKHLVIYRRLSTTSIIPRHPAIALRQLRGAAANLTSSHWLSKLLKHHSSSTCTCNTAVRLWCESRKLSVRFYLTLTSVACLILSINLMSWHAPSSAIFLE